MPAKSKIQDEQEAICWIEEGRPYSWIVDEYKKKYNIETSPSLWASFRSRRGLKRRTARNTDLIPWTVKEEHWFAYPLAMLRIEARVREGFDLREVDAKRHASWKKFLEEENAVVYYDADTEEGFFYVPREDGDTDIIRQPKQATRKL
ncbi:hypothetical protein GTY73_23770 [Streptomyces sp. SID8354]|nr:hypothetical protein [Streptomyces sp. SID8354]MYT31763.1 hypothetical protein [Streptomyces sp. SID8354]